eukprot:s2358_g4.t1
MDLVSLSSVVGRDQVLAGALDRAGWNTSRLGALHGSEPEVMRAIALGIEVVNPGLQVEASELQRLAALANVVAEGVWLVQGGAGDSPVLTGKMESIEARLNSERQESMREKREALERLGRAPRQRWPSRLGCMLASAGRNAESREEALRIEKERWVRRLTRLLEKGLETPGHGVSSVMAERAVERKGVPVVRKHVKVWERYMDWLVASHDISWPVESHHFQVYLVVRAMEPCNDTVLHSIWRTLRFMEETGEVPEDRRLSRTSAVRNTLVDVAAQLRFVDPKRRRQPRPLLTVMVQAMEEIVIDDTKGRYARAYAWYRLLKLWSGLTHQDAEGLDFCSIRLDVKGLVCQVKSGRSHDGGMGKATVYVGSEVYIDHPDWLVALFKILTVPGEDGILLDAGVGSIWSENAERATLRVWADAAGVPIEVGRLMGRRRSEAGQVSGDDLRKEVIKAQEQICCLIKANVGRDDPFGEEAIIEAAKKQLASQGASDFEVHDQGIRLRVFGGGGRPIKKQKTDSHWYQRRNTIRLTEEIFTACLVSSEEEEEVWKGRSTSRGDQTTGEKWRLGDFATAISTKSKSKVVHVVGGCHRQPGAHYKDFEFHGDAPPNIDGYHRVCGKCFPDKRGGHVRRPDDEDSSGESWITSSSDSGTD